MFFLIAIIPYKPKTPETIVRIYKYKLITAQLTFVY